MNIGELTAHIEVDHDRALRKIATTHQAFKGLAEAAQSVLLPLGIASTLPLLVSMTEGAWELSGALGMIPAVAGAVGLAMGTMAVATSGFGDAMKSIRDPEDFAEKIKTMAPAMQDAMLSIQKLLPVWDTLKERVQDAFWSNLNAHIDLLGSKYLPVLNTGMFKTATAMNRGASGVAQFMEESAQVSDVASSFDNMSIFVNKVANAFPNLIALLLDFVTVGSEKLPAMGEGFSSLIERFTKFIDKVRESGKLGEWLQQGIDSIKLLGQIVFNLGAVFVAVFESSGQKAGGFLVTLRDLTAQFLEWARSAEGQEKIGDLFATLSAFASALMGVLPGLTSIMFTLAGAFNMLPGPIQSIVASSIAWGGIIGFVITKVAPLISLLSMLKWSIVTTAASSVAASAVWIGRMIAMAAATVLNVTIMIGQLALWVARTIAGAAMAVAALTVGAAAYIAQWVLMAAGAMASAVVMAAAWFVALGPIGWAIGAIVALAALIFFNWDAISAKTSEIWNAIWNFIKQVIEWIKGKVAEGVAWIMEKIAQLKAIVAMVKGFFGAMKDAAIGKVMELVNWFKGLPGMIWDAISSLFSKMYDAGKRIIQSIIDGIKSMIPDVGGAISNVTSTIRNALPFSPAKWGPLSGSGSPDLAGQRIGQMIAEGIRRSVADVSSATAQMAHAANPQVTMLSGLLDNLPLKQDIIDGLQAALSNIKIEIDGAGVARLVNNGNLSNNRRRI